MNLLRCLRHPRLGLLVLLLAAGGLFAPLHAQTAPTLDRVEYYLDTDPGYGQGTAVALPASPGTSLAALPFTVNLAPLAAGFHSLSVRSKDTNGSWSQTYRQIFYVEPAASTAAPASLAAVEYFVDADPGYGQGTAAAITGGGTNATGVSFSVGLGSLAVGFHTLYYRVRDAAGKWSQTLGHLFYVDDPTVATLPNLNKTEYYFDADPGYGLGTNVPIATPAPSLPSLRVLADASALADGPHRLFVRVRDANGRWSQVLGRSFAKSGCASSLNLAAGLLAASYTAGGSVGNTPALAFAEPAPTPATTSTTAYAYSNGYLQVDLGTTQTISTVAYTLAAPSTTGLTLLVQTASAVAGPYTTVDTYSASLMAGQSYAVTRTLATPATGVRAVRLLLQNNAGTYVLVSGAGAYYFNCVGPALTSVAPSSGAIGSTISLAGTNLGGTSIITFSGASGNVVSSGFTVNAAGTAITGVVVPAGAVTGSVSVTNPSGTSNGVGFTVLAEPVLGSLAPASGPLGSTIALNGTDLTGATAITFAGTSGNVVTTGYAVNSAGTAITGVVVPSGAATGSVTLTTPNGTSNGLPFTVTVPAQPAQLAVSQGSTGYPDGGVAYDFGSQLAGTSGAAVAFTLRNAGGSPLAIISLATRGDYATTGAVPTSVAAGGTATVSVRFAPTATGTRPGTLVVASALGTYIVNLTGTAATPAAPVLASLTPASGAAGSTTALSSTSLTGATAITFAGSANNVVTAGYTVNAAGTAITGVVVPGGAATGNVTVTTPGGTSNGVAFAVLPDLVVSTGTLASPVSVAAGSYNSLTVTGSGVAVLLGSSVAGSVSVSGTLLTACQPLTGTASFTLAAGATLGICDPAGLSGTAGTGAVQTTGARSFSPDATYLYNGPVAQQTGDALPVQVRALTVANPQRVTLTQPVRIAQVLTLSAAGDLLLRDQPLTLLSSAVGTALVVNSGTGVVRGSTGTMQRYIDASGNLGSSGYRHYSAPVSGSTVADLATTAAGGSFAPVLNPAYNASTQPTAVQPFPTVFGYDQDRLATSPATSLAAFDKGYYSPAQPTDPLAVGRGYTVQIGNQELVDFTGTFTTGTVQLGGLARGSAPEAGWQLLGNPYPAPLDWGTVGMAGTGSGLSGLNAAAYVFQSTGPYTGRYHSFVNGVGAGTGIMAAGQGFFVRTSAAGMPGTLTLTNANRLTTYGSQPALQRTADLRPLLRLRLAASSAPAAALDEAFVYFEAGATASFDERYDADKLQNPSDYYLATALPGNTTTGLSVSGRAPLATTQADEVVPVWLSAPAGSYTLAAAELRNFGAMAGGTTVYLRDALQGTLTDLGQRPSYAFSVAAGAVSSGRFALVFRPAAALGTAAGQAPAQASLYPNPASRTATVVLAVTGLPAQVPTLTATLLDAIGRAVGRYPLAAAKGSAQLELPTAELPSGVYLLRLAAPDGPGQAAGPLPTLRLVVQ